MGYTLSHNLREQTRTRANPSTYIRGVNMKLTSMLMMLMGVMMMMMTVMDGVAAGECKDKLVEKRCTRLKELDFCFFPRLAKGCEKTCGKCLPSKTASQTGECKDKMGEKHCFMMIKFTSCYRGMAIKGCEKSCGKCSLPSKTA